MEVVDRILREEGEGGRGEKMNERENECGECMKKWA